MDALEAQMMMRSRQLTRYWDRASSGDWARVLATFSLFSGIGKRRLRKLARHATLTELAPGHTIVAGDVSDDSLYVILGGRAKARGDSGLEHSALATTSGKWACSTAGWAMQQLSRRASST